MTKNSESISATKTNALRHSIVASRGEQVTTIKITLDDDCGNGHEDFSVTADIREKDSRGRWANAGGGACHDHILSLCPELKPFVDLHLCTWQGIPMHCAANAWYWLAGALGLSYVEYHGSSGSDAKTKEECLRIFKEHVRCTDDELPALLKCRSQAELQIAIEDLGILQRWRQEADAAIEQLEAWTGQEFESSATRGQWVSATQEDRQLVAERRASGYYTPEAIAARDAEKAAAKKAKRRKGLLEDHDKAVRKLERKLEVELFILDNFDEKPNCIYYDHTNEVAVNWTTTEKLVTKDQFAAMVKVFEKLRTANLPEGIQMQWQERPKY
jgi:hypothetical protein